MSYFSEISVIDGVSRLLCFVIMFFHASGNNEKGKGPTLYFATSHLKKSPKLVREAKFEDKARNIVWFPSVINMGELGMIFPEGTTDKYVWKYAKIIDIPEEERVNYNNYSQRLDVENAETFKQQNFIGACKAMGITERIDNG